MPHFLSVVPGWQLDPLQQPVQQELLPDVIKHLPDLLPTVQEVKVGLLVYAQLPAVLQEAVLHVLVVLHAAQALPPFPQALVAVPAAQEDPDQHPAQQLPE